MNDGSSPRAAPHPLAGVALIVALAFIWGFNWPSMRAAVLEISPWTFRAVCLAVGTSMLFAIALAGGGRLRVPRREILPLIALGLLNVAAFHLLTAFGLTMIGAGRGVILGFTFPLWTVLLGVFVLSERLNRRCAAALLCGLGAMALLLGPEVTTVGRTPLGGLLLIGSAIAWAAATVLFKMRRWTLAAREMAAWQVLIGAVPVIIGAFLFGPAPDFSGVSARGLIGLVYSSVIAVSLGQWVWFRILEIMPASVASISSLAVPVIGVFASAALLGEAIGWRETAALALVLLALYLVLIGRETVAALRGLIGR